MANAQVHNIADYREECIHEQPRLLCSWCKPKPKKVKVSAWDRQGEEPFVRRPRTLDITNGPYTEASFESSCLGCGGDIEIGDIIGLRNETWICAPCAQEEDDMTKAKRHHPSFSYTPRQGA